MSNEQRRRLLKSLLVGSGAAVMRNDLPQSWHKPIIESIVLPAHAGVSSDIATYTASGATGIRVSQNGNESETGLASAIGSLIPLANAQIGQPQGNDGWYVCAVANIPGGTAQVTLAGMGGNVPANEVKVIRRGNLKLNGDEGSVVAADGDWATTCLGGSESELKRPAKIVDYTPGDTQIRVWIFGDFWVEIVADLTETGCLSEPPLATPESAPTQCKV